MTWVFAPIKADMGLLLGFLFIWNMLAALVLIPSLATFLVPESVCQQRRRHAMPTENARSFL